MHKKHKQVLSGEHGDTPDDKVETETSTAYHSTCDIDILSDNNTRPNRAHKLPIWLHDYETDM
jgi:hypothetical protein